MKRNLLIGILSLIFVSIAGQETQINQTKNRINIQYAGNIGVVSVGTGTSFLNNKIYLDFHYGYVHSHSIKNRIHTLALKISPIIASTDLTYSHLMFYCGSAFAYSFTNHTYMQYPSYFPHSYYDFPNSIHWNPYIGILCINHTKPFGVYMEIGSIDYKIIAAIRNDYLSFKDILNISFGISYLLK